jgi:NmrA-like family
MTDYFSHKTEKEEDITEEKEGRQMVEVAKSVGIKHLVWSTLPEVKERSGGKYKHVYHFDGKYRVEQYARTLGFEIASYVAPSCYMQNFAGGNTHVVFSSSVTRVTLG